MMDARTPALPAWSGEGEQAKWEDRTAIITGAASGIGREASLALSRAGARVVLVDRDKGGLEETRSLVGSGQALVFLADLLEAGVENAIVDEALEKFASPDILVNCAGVFPTRPALDLPVQEWDGVLNLNLRAPFLLSQAVARQIVSTGRSGSIVNIASTAGVVARPRVAHYCASKAALIMLTKVLAIEWAEHNIRVNAVAPGLVETPGVTGSLTTEEDEHEHQQKLAKVPLARSGEPWEIADAVVFLASSAASYVTGHTLFVDGGYSAGHTFRG